LFELIEFSLQNRIIEFLLHDFYRFHDLIFKIFEIWFIVFVFDTASISRKVDSDTEFSRFSIAICRVRIMMIRFSINW
jgi:hypothetical protein